MAIQAFFAGMFLANGIPHFVKGITGQKHMTPFKRVSDSYTNVIWGFINFAVGIFILGMDPYSGALNIPAGINLWVFILGAFIMSLMAAWLFSQPNAKLPWHKD